MASAWERQKASSVTNWSSKDRSFRSRRRHSAPADKGAWEAAPNEALRWLLLGSSLPVRYEGENVESGRFGAKRARKVRSTIALHVNVDRKSTRLNSSH